MIQMAFWKRTEIHYTLTSSNSYHHVLANYYSCLPPKWLTNPRNPTSSKFGALGIQKQSVGTKFKSQLFKLVNHLENTTPHFISCIKPNSKQLPGICEENLIFNSSGVVGFLRYGFLIWETNVPQDPLSISVAVLQQFNALPEMYQVGYTKVYLQSGQVGALEDRRKQVLQGIRGIQKCFRGHQARRSFHELKKGVITLQSCC